MGSVLGLGAQAERTWRAFQVYLRHGSCLPDSTPSSAGVGAILADTSWIKPVHRGEVIDTAYKAAKKTKWRAGGLDEDVAG